MIWSDEQNHTLQAVSAWFFSKNKPQVFRVFGFAGTGKTTLARHFASQVDGDVVFGAFTGKAALVLRNKGCPNASTIHSMIYKPVQHNDGTVDFVLNPNSAIQNCSLIIIDECSMVDQQLGNDLLSFGVPILVLGDPAQLPPIEGAGFFTNHQPDIMLTEIHRQAKDNPIIHLATQVRSKQKLSLGSYGNSIVTDKITENCFDKDQLIVGKNDTRLLMNRRARRYFGFDQEDPQIKEKLICLKNDCNLGIFNGGMFNVSRLLKNRSKYPFYSMAVVDEISQNGVKVKVHKSFFRPEIQKPHWKILKGTQQFDYGYAITGHKSQGSQWDNIVVYDESYCFGQDWWRWLYTSITRSAETVEVIMKE